MHVVQSTLKGSAVLLLRWRGGGGARVMVMLVEILAVDVAGETVVTVGWWWCGTAGCGSGCWMWYGGSRSKDKIPLSNSRNVTDTYSNDVIDSSGFGTL